LRKRFGKRLLREEVVRLAIALVMEHNLLAGKGASPAQSELHIALDRICRSILRTAKYEAKPVCSV
jgi:hypothetical protein